MRFKRIEFSKVYRRSEKIVECELGFIRRLCPNGVIYMVWVNNMDDSDVESNDDSVNEENRVVQEIMNYTAIAACDASVDNDTMAGVWKITNKSNNRIVEDYICYNQWELYGIVAAEVLILLQVVWYIF